MLEEKTGATPDAADQGILGEGLNQDATDSTGETGTEDAAQETKMVPLTALEDERHKRQQLESQTMSLSQQIAMMQQHPVQEMSQEAQDYFAKQGLEDDDVPTVAQLRGFAKEVTSERRRATAQDYAAAANAEFISSTSDYTDKIGSMNWMTQRFEYAQPLQEAMAANPRLMRKVMSNNITPEEAYTAVRLHEANNELARHKSTAKNKEAQKQVALKTGPLSGSAAGGGGAVRSASLNAGLDPHKPQDRDTILGNFQNILDGDYD